MSVGWATMSGAAINIIVAPWFDKRRGLAVSWALNGASAGGIIIAPLLTFLTARFGFVFAMVSVSASMLATLIPVAMAVLRPRRTDEYDPVERAAGITVQNRIVCQGVGLPSYHAAAQRRIHLDLGSVC